MSIEATTHDEYKESPASWSIEDSPERRFRKLRDLIYLKRILCAREVKLQGRKSAGYFMTSEFFAFPIDMTLNEAARCIRDNPRIDFLKGLFLLNAVGELQGYVPARHMLIYPSSTLLSHVMRPVQHKVTAESTREEVIELVERYKVFVLPVVDQENCLIGVISHEDLVGAIEDLTDETFAHMAGTNAKFTSQDSIFQRFTSRAPWLIVTLLAGLLNVGVMASFQKYDTGILEFAICFVPLITGLSGNIGLQCSTVLIRVMALGGLTLDGRRDTVSKEVFSGLFTGIIFGLACGLLVYLLDLLVGGALTTSAPFTVASIVTIGLIGACAAGTLLGAFSPLFFARIGVDPAIAAGPIVSAFNDFLSMVIYFLITCAVGQML